MDGSSIVMTATTTAARRPLPFSFLPQSSSTSPQSRRTISPSLPSASPPPPPSSHEIIPEAKNTNNVSNNNNNSNDGERDKKKRNVTIFLKGASLENYRKLPTKKQKLIASISHEQAPTFWKGVVDNNNDNDDNKEEGNSVTEEDVSIGSSLDAEEDIVWSTLIHPPGTTSGAAVAIPPVAVVPLTANAIVDNTLVTVTVTTTAFDMEKEEENGRATSPTARLVSLSPEGSPPHSPKNTIHIHNDNDNNSNSNDDSDNAIKFQVGSKCDDIHYADEDFDLQYSNPVLWNTLTYSTNQCNEQKNDNIQIQNGKQKITKRRYKDKQQQQQQQQHNQSIVRNSSHKEQETSSTIITYTPFTKTEYGTVSNPIRATLPLQCVYKTLSPAPTLTTPTAVTEAPPSYALTTTAATSRRRKTRNSNNYNYADYDYSNSTTSSSSSSTTSTTATQNQISQYSNAIPTISPTTVKSSITTTNYSNTTKQQQHEQQEEKIAVPPFSFKDFRRLWHTAVTRMGMQSTAQIESGAFLRDANNETRNVKSYHQQHHAVVEIVEDDDEKKKQKEVVDSSSSSSLKNNDNNDIVIKTESCSEDGDGVVVGGGGIEEENENNGTSTTAAVSSESNSMKTKRRKRQLSNVQKRAMYGRTKAEGMQSIIKMTNLKPNEIFLDIGHGLGNACIQAAFTVGCESRGIEVVPERCRMADLFMELMVERAEEIEREEKFKRPKVGKIDLREGSATDPQNRSFLTSADVVLVNNSNGIFGVRSGEMEGKPTVDSYVAGIFAQLKPHSRLVAFHPLLCLGRSLEEENERRLHKGMSFSTDASFFTCEKKVLGRNVVSWSCTKTIEVYLYTRVEQSSSISSNGMALFLCWNKECFGSTNPTAAVSEESGLLVEECVYCGASRAMKTRR